MWRCNQDLTVHLQSVCSVFGKTGCSAGLTSDPQLPLPLCLSPLWFLSLSTLLPNEAEIPLKAGFWKLRSSFHFLHITHTLGWCSAALSLPPPCKSLPPISWKSLHPPVLTAINRSAGNRALMIYASRRALDSQGKSHNKNTIHRGMISSKAISQLIWLPH